MMEKETGKWLKIEISAPPELMEAIGNFLTEAGVQGVFQESLAPQQNAGDFPKRQTKKSSKPTFRRTTAVKKELPPCRNT